MPEVPHTAVNVLIAHHVPTGRIDALETGAFALVGKGVCMACRSREWSPATRRFWPTANVPNHESPPRKLSLGRLRRAGLVKVFAQPSNPAQQRQLVPLSQRQTDRAHLQRVGFRCRLAAGAFSGATALFLFAQSASPRSRSRSCCASSSARPKSPI